MRLVEYDLTILSKAVVLKLFCTLTPNESIQFSVDPVA